MRSIINSSSWEKHPKVTELLRRVEQAVSPKKASGAAPNIVGSTLKHYVDLSALTDAPNYRPEARLELLSQSLQQLSSLSLEDAVHLLSVVSLSTPAWSSSSSNAVPLALESSVKETTFWNEVAYELSRLYFLPSLADTATGKSPQLDPTSVLKLLDVFCSVQFAFTDAHRCMLTSMMNSVISLLHFPTLPSHTEDPQRCIVQSSVNNVVDACRGIAHFLSLQHLDMCIPFLRRVQSVLLNDTRPLAIFLNHFRDSHLEHTVSVNDVVEVFHALCAVGIFSPEFLSTALLFRRRHAHELEPKTHVYLLRAASAFVTQTPLPLRSIEPHWIMREPVLQLRENEIKNIQKSMFFSESDPVTTTDQFEEAPTRTSCVQEPHPTSRPTYDNRDRSCGLVDTSQHSTQPGGWYDQSFFDDFDKMLNKETTNILSQTEFASNNLTGEQARSNLEEERFTDVTEAWLVHDKILDIPRRIAEAEAVYLIKSICKWIETHPVLHFSNWEIAALFETLATIGYVPGRLIDHLVNDFIAPRVMFFTPSQTLSLLQSFVRLDIRCIKFLQATCRQIIESSAKYTCAELVAVSDALMSLQCGHPDLLLQIMARKDELLQPVVNSDSLKRLQIAFRSLEIQFPELDEALQHSRQS